MNPLLEYASLVGLGIIFGLLAAMAFYSRRAETQRTQHEHEIESLSAQQRRAYEETLYEYQRTATTKAIERFRLGHAIGLIQGRREHQGASGTAPATGEKLPAYSRN